MTDEKGLVTKVITEETTITTTRASPSRKYVLKGEFKSYPVIFISEILTI